MTSSAESHEGTQETPGKTRLEVLSDPNSPYLSSYQALMAKVFPAEELDSIEVTQEALRSNEDPERRADLVIILKLDERNKVVAAINASYLPALGDNNEKLGWSSVCVNYIVADPDSRGKGVAAGLYPALSERCNEIAAKAKEEIRFVVGETVNAVESLVNRTGRARLYFERDGKMEEVKYEQATLEWENDGAPLTDAVPLHFMATPTEGGKTIKTADLLKVVDSIYDENSRGNAKTTCTEDGYQKACKVVEATFAKLKAQLEGVKELRMISKEERERMQAEGTAFTEHEVEA